MNYNVKGKFLYIRSHNDCTSYSVKGSELGKASEEKDLGVFFSKGLKLDEHCSVFKIANKFVGFIGSAYEFKSENVLTLFIALVGPHL